MEKKGRHNITIYYNTTNSISAGNLNTLLQYYISMAEKFVTSIRIDKQIWKEAKKHAIEKETTVGKLIEDLLKKEIKK
jgi:hypothetical protein